MEEDQIIIEASGDAYDIQASVGDGIFVSINPDAVFVPSLSWVDNFDGTSTTTLFDDEGNPLERFTQPTPRTTEPKPGNLKRLWMLVKRFLR